jgi:hypothetical protein
MLRAYVYIEGGSDGVRLGVKPVTIPFCANGVVSPEDVIRMSDPEASWCHVSVEQTERCMHLDN